MFRIKICGITNVEDALMAAESGADAIGINFYPPSPRYCQLAQAREIAQATPKHVCKVGVFVNAKVEDVVAIAESVGLDMIQLHGDEPAELISQLAPWPVVRAFRLGKDSTPVVDYLRRCAAGSSLPRMILFDAFRPDLYGGTGDSLDWDALHGHRSWLGDVPLVLAGGLKPSNVAAAIAAAHPRAVDTASGVESAPGKKSPTLVRDFVQAARAAFSLADAR